MDEPVNDIAVPVGVNQELGLLLGCLRTSTATWRNLLVDVSDNVVVWQPFPGGHSIGALILHMCFCEVRWIHEVAGGEPVTPEQWKALLREETDPFTITWPTPPSKPLSWYIEQQDQIRRHSLGLLTAINDPHHLSTKGDEQYTLRWIIDRMISHESYHGGQMVLLSLMYMSRL